MVAAILMAVAAPASAQVAKPSVIPFKIVNDHIEVAVVVGGRPVQALLDSGAPLTEIDLGRAGQMGLRIDPSIKVSSGFSARPGEGFVGGKPLSIGGWSSSEPIYLTDLSATQQMGQTGIIVGADLFRAFVVEVDFDARRIVLHDRANFIPPAGVGVLSVERRAFGYFTSLVIDGGAPVAANIDLGANASLLLNADTTRRLGLSDRPGAVQRGCVGVGGEQSCQTGVAARTVRLGDFVFQDVPLVLASASDPVFGNLDSNLGLGLLGRFHLWMDFGGGRLWLKPNSHFEDPYRHTIGCAFRMTEQGVELAGVVQGGAAAKAGLRTGDQVIAIDGATGGEAMLLAVDAAKLSGRAMIFQMADGRVVRIEPGERV